MDAHWTRVHAEKLGTNQRIDVKDPFQTYRTIIQTEYVGKYTDYDTFIRRSFHPFCLGFLSIDDAQTQEQHYPIAWGISKNRYSHYKQLGEPILKNQQSLSQNLSSCQYRVLNVQSLDKDKVLMKSFEKFRQILDIAKTCLSSSVSKFYFDRDSLSFQGVEVSIRLIIKCPWKSNSQLRGEFYKHLYGHILPQMNDTRVSVRLYNEQEET